MQILGTLVSVGLIFFLLMDSFETAILPRRVTHRFRFARFFYRNTWWLWRTVALSIKAGKAREEPFFSTYLYWSGGTFFTLGPGDVTTHSWLGRGLAVVEAGLGFGFLA